MSGTAKFSADPFNNFDQPAVVRDELKQFERFVRVLFAIEGQRRKVFRDLVPVAIIRFFFLQPAESGNRIFNRSAVPREQ